MPKSTFYNLSDEKKGRILDAALQEFSTRRFSEASLNQIIKNAGIPKGSFYQYFNNKEDIYLCLLESGSKENTEFLNYVKGMDSNSDVFEVIMNETREFHERGKVKPGYVEAAMLMELDNSEFIMKLRKSSAEKYVKILERDKERGLIKPEVDSELVINMITTFSYNEYFRNGADKERYLKNLGNAIKIIRDGVAVSKD
jgi:TetR/AcrR family transcriptional regulator